MRIFGRSPPETPGTTGESAPQPSGPVTTATANPAGDSALRGEARFQVEEVVNIWGMGCLATGRLQVGSVRPNDSVRVVPGPGSKTTPTQATIHSIGAHHKVLEILEPGTEAGLFLRGIGQRAHRMRHITWDLQKGDFLVYP